ncbi:transglutaminase-like cysteine peptidase [Devosia sp. BK]|uniref:transglutaminase-like cysteine peptidase n=1 Tax=Devosia sp. BK TaxID=2871706 RepID=UPI002939B395|nr:transglutaminase-like cysteine peptidase [Devosia sp. BK]MDV3253195.1 transglutaminase-like cysteine peptidase [Devosia sp. BK]
MKKVVFAAVVSAVAMFGSVDMAFANRPTNIVVQERVSARGPESFQVFCAINPGECQPGGDAKIALDDDVMRLLTRVNARVNRAIRPRLDSPLAQVWRVNPSVGDCKSYVVSKRHELIRAGLSPSALRIAYVKTRDGQGHAVLVVKTHNGDLTLDNLTGEIRLFRQTGYRVVGMSGSDPRRWG